MSIHAVEGEINAVEVGMIRIRDEGRASDENRIRGSPGSDRARGELNYLRASQDYQCEVLDSWFRIVAEPVVVALARYVVPTFLVRERAQTQNLALAR